jgi:hypothetical protein
MDLSASPRTRDDAPGSARSDISVEPVDRIFHARRARARYLPEDLFAEPA